MRIVSSAFAPAFALCIAFAGAAEARQKPPESGALMQTNAAAIAIIKESEGLRLDAYSDGRRWLIGYGHTATAKKGMRITTARAETLLKEDLAACESAIAKAVKRAPTKNQHGAMASLCYNIGTWNFATSTVVAKFNAGDMRAAADAFRLWNKGQVNGVKEVIPHLAARREKERALFLKK